MYTSYLREDFNIDKIEDIHNTSLNKPGGGLWGCRNNEWKTWCKYEKFSCGKKKVEWEYTGNILYINNKQDFIDMWNKYNTHEPKYTSLKFIDFEKMSKDYDGMEISEEALWSCRLSLSMEYNLGLYAWDVPSVVIFDKNKVKVKVPILN